MLEIIGKTCLEYVPKRPNIFLNPLGYLVKPGIQAHAEGSALESITLKLTTVYATTSLTDN